MIGRRLAFAIAAAWLVSGVAVAQEPDDPWEGMRREGSAQTRAAPRPPVPAATAPAPAAPRPAAASPKPATAPLPVAAVPFPVPRPAIPAPAEVAAVDAGTIGRIAPLSAAPVQPGSMPPPRTVAAAPPASGDAELLAAQAPPESPAAAAPPLAESPSAQAEAPPAAVAPAVAPVPASSAASDPAMPAVSVPAAVPPSAAASTPTAAPPPVPADSATPEPAAAASVSPAPAAQVSPAAPSVPPPLPAQAAASGASAPVAPTTTVPAPVAPVPPVASSVPSAAPLAPAQASATSAAPAPAPAAPVPTAAPSIASAPPPVPAQAPSTAASTAPAPPASPPPAALAAGAGSAAPASPSSAQPAAIDTTAGNAVTPLWPQELVRSLRRVQDRLAAGDTSALAGQRALIERIEREFAAADPNLWRDPRNARAAVTYFLSGGTPSVLRRMMSQQPPMAVDQRLLRGTLAYLEGREEEALRQLSEIDARSLPANLGGQVALAQGAVWVRKDPKRTLQLLDTARLLAPGTLVEEAALRRAIVVAGQLGDAAAFEHLSKQYLFRFRNSVYADNFRQRFASSISRMSFLNDPGQFHRIDDMLKLLEPATRRDMELSLARAAVVQGKTEAANLVAQRALAGVPSTSADADRARLYRGAALAPSAATYSAALSDLKTVDRDRLGPADAALLDAAAATASMVQRAGETIAKTPPPARPVALPKEEELPVMERARAAVAAVDDILKGPQR